MIDIIKAFGEVIIAVAVFWAIGVTGALAVACVRDLWRDIRRSRRGRGRR